jgi:hypothetical protein
MVTWSYLGLSLVKAQCIGIVPKRTLPPIQSSRPFWLIDCTSGFYPGSTRMYIRVLSRMPSTRSYTYNASNDPVNNHPAAARRLFPTGDEQFVHRNTSNHLDQMRRSSPDASLLGGMPFMASPPNYSRSSPVIGYISSLCRQSSTADYSLPQMAEFTRTTVPANLFLTSNTYRVDHMLK